MKKLKRVGAFIYVPLLFMFFGYLTIYIIGAPVINFASSAVELISLNDAPSFEQKGNNLFAERSQEKNKHQTTSRQILHRPKQDKQLTEQERLKPLEQKL